MSVAPETTPRKPRRPGKWRWVAGAIAIVVLIAVAAWLPGALGKKLETKAAAADSPDDSQLKLTSAEPPIVKMPAEMVQRLGVKTAEVEPYSSPRVLKLDGTLLIDPSNHGPRPFPLSRRNHGNGPFGARQSEVAADALRRPRRKRAASWRPFGARIWARRRANSSTRFCICGSTTKR